MSLFRASALINTSAAAPSLSVLALAAVTVPEDGKSAPIRAQQSDWRGRCGSTILSLEHRLKVGNLVEVNAPPLLIFGHEHVSLACNTSPTSALLQKSGSGGVASTSLSNTNSHDLFGQDSGLVSCFAAAVRANGVGVLFLPADVALLGCVLCTVALVTTSNIHKHVYRKPSPQEDSAGVFGSSSSSYCRRPL